MEPFEFSVDGVSIDGNYFRRTIINFLWGKTSYVVIAYKSNIVNTWRLNIVSVYFVLVIVKHSIGFNIILIVGVSGEIVVEVVRIYW